MAFDVLLDTCVIYPANLRDTLLRLAEADLYRPRWSADIMVELDRNLVKHGVNPAGVARLTTAMNEAFLEANVTDSTLQRQADSNRREPRTLQALLDALAKAGVPRFVAEVRRHQ